MKLMQSPAPHIRHGESNVTLMLDVILLLTVLCGMSCFFHGLRALYVCLVSVATCIATDVICTLLRGKSPSLWDLSPLVTGLILALLMPATISYGIAAAAGFFAIAIVKHPFGGMGNNAFNPAAGGFSFAATCWPTQMFLYPMPFDRLPSGGVFTEGLNAYVYTSGTAAAAQEMTGRLYQGSAAVLKLGGTPTISYFEVLFGNYPGAMGATHIAVLLMCMAYLIFRKTVRWQLPLMYILSCSVMAMIFGRTGGGMLENLVYEMSSGMVLFAGVFMVTDPVSGPRRETSVALYGALMGIITMLFRFYGGFEEGVTFAILFVNAFVPLLDKWSESFHQWIRRRRNAHGKAEAGV